MFTVATALSRLAAGPRNLFVTAAGTMSAPQQLARFNEVMEGFYVDGTWRGVRTTVSLTSTSGIISLAAGYLRLDGLSVTTDGQRQPIDIKGEEWRYQPNGPGVFDVTKGYCGVAIDLGDNGSGVRRYQLTGDADTLDDLTFEGLARKRFVYITDTATVVVPDCYPALVLGVRAKNAEDEGANELAQDLWAQALAKLDSDLGQFEMGNDWGSMQIDPLCAAGTHYNAI